ncbi:tRNA lysidine(34) synthetase TilS [Nocardioides sp. R-C-SC26]|uniref:tRNA lysidine(34) synthetase TilS n=1 Tax=Nocardioides sp. R-C-SC26 TaxID=2870414 RepID=UPI001E31CB72|nr:tRNA lysidine(34) synthetase TilS [Nocardioides sp. R-C-SC26]
MTLPPAVAAVRVAVRGCLVRESPDVVAVACSGGADSLALLAATVFEARSRDVRVIGVTVDHGLQPESADHAAHVVAQMAALGVHETVGARVDVEASGRGIEAAAREARYAVLDQVADHFSVDLVLVGHTLDDQAETVLLGLTRGSGGRSIAGMRPAFDRIRRPLLGITREQTEQACRDEDIEFWRDPHNLDPRFARARVRHTVLPVLETELGPGVAQTLARTAETLRPDMELLDDLADLAYLAARVDDGLDLDRLDDEHVAIRTRVLRLAALAAGSPASELFHVHVRALLALGDGHVRGEVQLPGRVTAVREARRLRFGPTSTG